jgi:hypothetical protein
MYTAYIFCDSTENESQAREFVAQYSNRSVFMGTVDSRHLFKSTNIVIIFTSVNTCLVDSLLSNIVAEAGLVILTQDGVEFSKVCIEGIPRRKMSEKHSL